MIEPDGQKILQFCMLEIAGKRNFKCKLRYLEKCLLKNENIYQTRNSES